MPILYTAYGNEIMFRMKQLTHGLKSMIFKTVWAQNASSTPFNIAYAIENYNPDCETAAMLKHFHSNLKRIWILYLTFSHLISKLIRKIEIHVNMRNVHYTQSIRERLHQVEVFDRSPELKLLYALHTFMLGTKWPNSIFVFKLFVIRRKHSRIFTLLELKITQFNCIMFFTLYLLNRPSLLRKNNRTNYPCEL